MYIRNLYITSAYRAGTAVFLFCGIILHFSFTDADVTAHNFSYFTVQSNLLCLAAVLGFLFRDLKKLRARNFPETGGRSRGEFIPVAKDWHLRKAFDPSRNVPVRSASRPDFLTELKFAATLCIAVTFLCNHAVVSLSHTYTGGVLGLPMKSFLAHYVSPILILIDWIFFTPKGTLSATSPLKWLFAPLLYLIVIMVRGLCCEAEVLERTGKYPYFFLNVDLVGSRVFIYLSFGLAGFLLIGYLIWLIDAVLGKLSFTAEKNGTVY